MGSRTSPQPQTVHVVVVVVSSRWASPAREGSSSGRDGRPCSDPSSKMLLGGPLGGGGACRGAWRLEAGFGFSASAGRRILTSRPDLQRTESEVIKVRSRRFGAFALRRRLCVWHMERQDLHSDRVHGRTCSASSTARHSTCRCHRRRPPPTPPPPPPGRPWRGPRFVMSRPGIYTTDGKRRAFLRANGLHGRRHGHASCGLRRRRWLLPALAPEDPAGLDLRA